ncbi:MULTISPECIES: hypothetical protein [unclassified Novosphingobium]|uniref:hypothetical protein n=1 Tax=unclassified Novosphingobium TaxID=2644732 RepID=UPI00146EEB23|nr:MULTISPECIES: hypothetical protein [unclassified Novosphingobium]NMN06474.1 hypothetical protein [Novosphingobium sp. SG919]NMN89078.1 hypothetical protein [Novosphingobium sp. SG916]
MTDLSLHGIPLATVLRLNAARVVPLACYHEDNAYDRFGYLAQLACEQGVALDTVVYLAELLGPEEDFDGLVAMLEDLALAGSAGRA